MSAVDPQGYRLTGSKRHVSNGHLADLVLVAAKAPPSAGISLLLVERHNVEGSARARSPN